MTTRNRLHTNDRMSLHIYSGIETKTKLANAFLKIKHGKSCFVSCILAYLSSKEHVSLCLHDITLLADLQNMDRR